MRMKRSKKELNEKNDIIFQIQQNLRKGKDSFNYSKPLNLSPNKKHVDLPNISYGPNNSPRYSTKSSNKNLKDPFKVSPQKQKFNKIGYVQTISFNNEKQKSSQNLIIVNNRRPIRNILRSSARYGDKQIDQDSLSDNIFLSTQKCGSLTKFNPTQKTKYSSQVMNMFENKSTDSPSKQGRKENQQKYPIQVLEINKRGNEKASFIIDRLYERTKKFKEKTVQSLNSTTLSPKKIPKQKKLQAIKEDVQKPKEKNFNFNPSLVRSMRYSPWTSDHSEEIHEIWTSEQN